MSLSFDRNIDQLEKTSQQTKQSYTTNTNKIKKEPVTVLFYFALEFIGLNVFNLIFLIMTLLFIYLLLLSRGMFCAFVLILAALSLI